MTSVNNKTNQDVYAAFNKLNQDAATNDANMSGTVKDDALALAQTLMNDGDLSAADKSSLVQQAADLLPMAGEGGHAAEWNADMQKLADQLSSLSATPSSAAAATNNNTTSSTSNLQVFTAFNTLNNLAGSNPTGNSAALKSAAQSLLTMVQGDENLSSAQQTDLESKINNLITMAGQSSGGSAWNSTMQSVVDELAQVAQGSTSASGTDDASGVDDSGSSSATGATSSNGSSSSTSNGTTSTTSGGTSAAQSSNAGSTVVPTSQGSASSSDTTLYPSGNGPQLADVQQGSLNDCTIDAALSSLAQNNPSDIENMFTKNTDGTYNVTLYPAGVKTTVTIDPTKDLVSGGTRGSNGKADWASMIEAAAVKVGFSLDNGNGAQPGDAMLLLTGTGGVQVDTSDFGSTSALEKGLTSELASGKLVMAGWVPTDGSTSKTVDGMTIDANHAYAVLSVSNGEVTVRNPWANQANNGVMTMSLADYESAFPLTFMED